MQKITDQALPHIVSLAPYQASMSPAEFQRQYGIAEDEMIQIASNENPYGMSLRAQEVVARGANGLNRYPNNQELCQELADIHGLDISQVAVGSGSNDLLDLVARVYLDGGDEAISGRYAFSVYTIATQTAGAENIVTPAKEYGLDLAAMQRAITEKTKIIWLVNPNNPTGTFLPYSEVYAFMQSVPKHIIAVLDEAYFEYLDPDQQVDTIEWLKEFPNLVIMRTFSKIYGLAGLRVGYCFAAPEIITLINRTRLPFNVNNLALLAASEAIKDQDFVQESYVKNRAERQYLQDGFAHLDIKYIPSYTNFVVIELNDVPSAFKALLGKGIITRPLAGYGLPNHLRITIGKHEENERLLESLEEFIR